MVRGRSQSEEVAMKVVASMYKIPAGFDSAFPSVTVLDQHIRRSNFRQTPKKFGKEQVGSIRIWFQFSMG